MEVIQVNQNMSKSQSKSIENTFNQERGRLLNFIKSRVKDADQAEDIMQDVFFQLINAYDTIESLEKQTSWLFTVARNKITDFYRKKKTVSLNSIQSEDQSDLWLENIMPDIDNLPDHVYLKKIIWETLEEALEDLPYKQREVFIAHEFENKSFKQISAETGVSVNTLLTRKRYAILYLREQLMELYEELKSE
jgi:RNA polymerase sigma factor (sigma-70 family)